MPTTNEPSVAICVAGWHFNEPFYRDVMKLGGDVFVMSHRPRQDVPDYVYNYVGRDKVFHESNRGYDWGCYQQFLNKGIWRHYDYHLFMHDDLIIHDLGIITACRKALEKFSVVGNGQGSDRTDHPAHAPQSYAHGFWKPPSQSFKHDVVRGSFFATTRGALARLGRFEVFWDTLQLSERFGNWSTRASCGRWTAALGPDCIGFLAETYRKSLYMSEEERGGMGREARDATGWKGRISGLINGQASRYMEIYWMPQKSLRLSLRLWMLALSLACCSGSLGPLWLNRRVKAE